MTRSTGDTVMVPSGESVDALTERVGVLCDRVLGAEAAAYNAIGALVAAQRQRYEDAVHYVYTNLTRGLQLGDRPRVQACLLAGCNTLEHLQNDWNTGRMETVRGLLAAAADLRSVTNLLTERFGITAAEAPAAISEHPEQPVEARVGAKRRRLTELAERRERGAGERAALVDALRDPAAAFGTGLSADEHRLLATVLGECALVPDIALMRDAWHPGLCLYDTSGDRAWHGAATAAAVAGGSLHISTFSSVIATEFLRTRDDPGRFTFIHVMAAMGFGPPDVAHYLPFVEQTFYDRVCADAVICFLAETNAPRVTVFRGAEWAPLIDVYVAHHHGIVPGAWDGARRYTAFDALAAALAGGSSPPDAGAVPTTVLGGLHRLRTQGRASLDSTGVTSAVQALDDGFCAAVRRNGDPSVTAHLDRWTLRARAWPAPLRALAVEHVRGLVRRLRLLPCCPDLPRVVGAPAHLDTAELATWTASWLWRIRTSAAAAEAGDLAAGEEGASDRHVVAAVLRSAVAESLSRYPAAAMPTIVAQCCTELSEAECWAETERTYGPITERHRSHLSTHLANMERILTESFRFDRRFWTEDDRRRLGVDPVEMVRDFRVAAECGGSLLDEDDLRVRYMRAFRRTAEDGALDAEAAVTGSSAMRDPALFPPPRDEECTDDCTP